MTRAIAASESEITEVRAPVLLNNCSLCLNPPSRMDSPRTSRILPTMDPVIEAFTTLVSPLESAMAAMISSAALPKVAFKSPPSPSPTRAASSSVARPIQPATGMIASAEQTKSAVELTWPAVWIDLCEPTPEEEQLLEAALGLDMPTREEMQAIELSSRLYKEGIIPRVASSTKLTLPAQNRIVKIVSIAAVVFLPPT